MAAQSVSKASQKSSCGGRREQQQHSSHRHRPTSGRPPQRWISLQELVGNDTRWWCLFLYCLHYAVGELFCLHLSIINSTSRIGVTTTNDTLQLATTVSHIVITTFMVIATFIVITTFIVTYCRTSSELCFQIKSTNETKPNQIETRSLRVQSMHVNSSNKKEQPAHPQISSEPNAATTTGLINHRRQQQHPRRYSPPPTVLLFKDFSNKNNDASTMLLAPWLGSDVMPLVKVRTWPPWPQQSTSMALATTTKWMNDARKFSPTASRSSYVVRPERSIHTIQEVCRIMTFQVQASAYKHVGSRSR